MNKTLLFPFFFLLSSGCGGKVLGDPNATFNLDATFSQREESAIRYAVQEWNSATDGIVDFGILREPGPISEHDIKISKHRGVLTECVGKSGHFYGCTQVDYRGTDIQMTAVEDYDSTPTANLQLFECAILHEFGHYMGLGHSKDPQDAMYKYNGVQGDGKCQLSSGDLYQFHQVTGL